MEETNSYAAFMRDELQKDYYLHWGGCTVADIAKYIGICMWMGVIQLPDMRMF